MKILEVALLINAVLWAAAMVFLVYAIGVAILTFHIHVFITALILAAFAIAAEFILAVLNDW